MAGLASPMFDLLGNTDTLGWAGIANNPSVTAESLAELSEDFGGVDYDQALSQCPVPCKTAAKVAPIEGLRQLDQCMGQRGRTGAMTSPTPPYKAVLRKCAH